MALGGLLVATGVLYLWNLGASGWANAYYSAAVQAGSQNWTAMLFGSSDAANAITVDKPPAALWVMDLSARLFGFKRAIVHGTWTLARALALSRLPQTDAFTLDASFRRPVELPSDILVRAWTGPGADPGGACSRQHRVRVSALDGGKTCLDIVLAESATRH